MNDRLGAIASKLGTEDVGSDIDAMDDEWISDMYGLAKREQEESDELPANDWENWLDNG